MTQPDVKGAVPVSRVQAVGRTMLWMAAVAGR